MMYKGQELSDNLTQSQINMYKYYIDQGFTVDQILDMYIEPVLRDEEGDNI